MSKGRREGGGGSGSGLVLGLLWLELEPVCRDLAEGHGQG
jgi:hypothetical protein